MTDINLLSGNVTVVVTADSSVSYGKAEAALQQHGFKSFIINRHEIQGGRAELTLSVNQPIEEITAAGIPEVGAVKTLRALADAIESLEAGS